MRVLEVFNVNRKFDKIILYSFIVLFLGHFALGIYVSSKIINILTIFIITFVLYAKFLYKKHDLFSFLLVIFFCSHFRYGVSNGGLFNLIAAVSLLTYFLFNYKKYESKISYSNLLISGIIIFIIANIFGWAGKNPFRGLELAFGILSFFGFISVFLTMSTLRLTIDRLRLLLKVLDFYVIYSFIACTNQYLNLIRINSPLLYGSDLNNRHAFGLFGDSEIFGEYSLILFMFYLPLLFSDIPRLALKINYTRILIIVLLVLVQCLMSASRSVFLLIIFGVILLIIFNKIFRIKVLNRTSNFAPLFIVSIGFILFLSFFIIKDISYVIERMGRLNFSKINLSTFISGEEINRAYAFSFAFVRLAEESWWLGWGWGVRDSNALAWFPDAFFRLKRADYHSLYLSLPMIFGWVGTGSFIYMIYHILKHNITLIIKNRKKYSYIVLASVSYVLLISLFIINEYKINSMRWPQYFLIVWFWLGFGNSILNTSNNFKT